MYIAEVTIENFRCFSDGPDRFKMHLNRGLTALVGENDVGKTAIIDALRLALGTTDQDWYRLEDADFYNEDSAREIRIVCKFEGLSETDAIAFLEFLTYVDDRSMEPVLYVNCTAKQSADTFTSRPYRRLGVHSGKDGTGPSLPPEVRDLLRATYLRPLRDAEDALSAGRGSRLSQILRQAHEIKTAGVGYDPTGQNLPENLNVLGIGDLANALLAKQKGIVDTRGKVDKHLKGLSFAFDDIQSTIKVSGSKASDDHRLCQLLEKLDLVLGATGKVGLGSNNLLFIASELLLLAQEEAGAKLLLIEEPEAHLHAQRQLRVMKSLQHDATEKGVQILVTTHSPTLASAIELDNLVIIRNRRAFPLAEGRTKLDSSDYRFLTRFLDATKANLFFARGVMIVEGDAENILLPTLARLIGRDLTDHGVSIVNVGGIGLHRYARVFQRANPVEDGALDIPVACVTDMDVMPDCAPVITGRVEAGKPWPAAVDRRWRAKSDIGGEDALCKVRSEKRARASGQSVRTFVSDEWTLEYDLALGPKNPTAGTRIGLAEDVYIAACLAKKDDAISAKKSTVEEVAKAALSDFAELSAAVETSEGCSPEEVLATKVYAQFAKHQASKAVAAQYLAERLQNRYSTRELTEELLRKRLPNYLVDAIDYVTGLPDRRAGVGGN